MPPRLRNCLSIRAFVISSLKNVVLIDMPALAATAPVCVPRLLQADWRHPLILLVCRSHQIIRHLSNSCSRRLSRETLSEHSPLCLCGMMTKTLVLKSPAATGCLSLRTQLAASIPDNRLTRSSPPSKKPSCCRRSSDSLLHLFTFTFILPGLLMMSGIRW